MWKLNPDGGFEAGLDKGTVIVDGSGGKIEDESKGKDNTDC